jgi:hypothetical protein
MGGEGNENKSGQEGQDRKETAIAIRQGATAADLMVPETTNPIEIIGKQIKLIQEVYKTHMRPDVDYGVIPGTNKPSLYKPGAEKIGFMFHFVPEFDVTRFDYPGGHREYEIKCRLMAKGGLSKLGEGVGSCSTLEKKYRYRTEAGAPVKPVPKEFWTLRDAGDTAGMKQISGGLRFSKINGAYMFCAEGKQIENPDIADLYNTVLKMAKKRAFVDATLTVSGVSDTFTQDVEDMQNNGNGNNDKGEGKNGEEKTKEQPKAQAPSEKQKSELYAECLKQGIKIDPKKMEGLSITEQNTQMTGLLVEARIEKEKTSASPAAKAESAAPESDSSLELSLAPLFLKDTRTVKFVCAEIMSFAKKSTSPKAPFVFKVFDGSRNAEIQMWDKPADNIAAGAFVKFSDLTMNTYRDTKQWTAATIELLIEKEA